MVQVDTVVALHTMAVGMVAVDTVVVVMVVAKRTAIRLSAVKDTELPIS